MLAQLLLNVGASIAGGIAGHFESKNANMVELKKIDADRERDMMLGQLNQVQAFYESLDRSDDPKKIVSKGHSFFGFGKAYEKTTYRYAPIPARRNRFIIMCLLASAYAFAVSFCAFGADIPISSFPTQPESYKWLSLFGFSLVEGVKNDVYELTLGGLILPLLSPISFAITKYVTGADSRK